MRNKAVMLPLMVLILMVPSLCASQQGDQKPLVAGKLHQVNPDLSNIVNLEQFGAFTPKQTELLSRNGFVVTPSGEKQLYHIYETNDYYQIPSFITTDLVLQAYHIFFNYTLRTVESEKLYDIAVELNERMLQESISTYQGLENPEVKQAALKNVAFFAVALKLFTVEKETLQALKDADRWHEPGWELKLPASSSLPMSLPPDAKALVEKELVLILKHENRTSSNIFGFELDYTQFVPRGHYTRTERLKRYFQGMMWYGLVPLPLSSPEQAIQTILFTHILFNSKEEKVPLIELWEKLYYPTVFYVGTTDDLNPFDCRELVEEVYGGQLNLDDVPSRLDVFLEASERLPEPRIKPFLIGIPTGKQFRFMGQRYIPDSEILQRLSNWPNRPFPKGLDIMAVLGSHRAYDILMDTFQEDKGWPEYTFEMDTLKEQFSKLDTSTWQSNLYYGWLWCLQALLQDKEEKCPFFMTNQAWQDKVLNTTCASWAELRHDTILYGKQSGAECGGDAEEPPPPPKGYVEPEVEFYSRLEWLTGFTRDGLTTREIITSSMEQKFDYLQDLVSFLKKVSLKELGGELLTREEYDQIKIIGAEMERLSLSVADAGWYTDIDRDMAVVADVHTSQSSCLEEAVGHANEIYVVVPIEGELYLTRGAVFSYYEFTHPTRNRLTDEKWQEMLDLEPTPALPVWTNGFMSGKKEALPRPKKIYNSGC